MDFKLVDYVRSWQDSWQQLKDNVDDYFRINNGEDWRNWPIHIESASLVLDLLRIEDFANVDVFSGVNLIIFNHVISELINSLEEFREIFNIMVNTCPDETKFLFIDIDQRQVVDEIDRLLEGEARLEILDQWNGTFQVDPSEDKADLGKWNKVLSGKPRLKCQAFYKICYKIDW